MTPEKLAALREAAEKSTRCQWGDAFEWAAVSGDRHEGEFIALASPTAILALLDHIAKLEAGRDAALEECAAQFDRFFAPADEVSIDYVVGSIRALKSAPLNDDQRHEAVAKILKDTP